MSRLSAFSVLSLTVLIVGLMALPALPALAFGANVVVSGLPQGTNLAGRISNFVGAVITLVAIVAAIGIIYGGFRYITAFGNEDAAEKGKKAVLYSVIGLIIIGLSVIIVNWVVNAI